MTEARLTIKVDSKDVERGNKSLKELAETGGKAEKSTKQLTSATETLTRAAKTAAGALALTFSTREIIQYSDAWQSASNQLRLVTDGASQLAEVQRILLGVSNETRSSFESTANLYTRLTRATTEMNLSQQELVDLTRTINQSFAVSGATATEAAAAITQLSQGLAAGALRGDEFNSVAEQAPGIMMAIAQSLNMTVGELRGFAAEGGITAQIVVDALQQAADSIDKDFSKANVTFGQSMQIAQNNVMEFIGTNNVLQGTVSKSGEVVVFLSENMDILQGILITTGAIVVSRYVPAMVSATASTVSMTSATAAFGGALRLVGGPIGATIIAIGSLAMAYQRLEKTAKQATENAFNYNVAQGARTIELAMYDLTQQLADVRDRTTETIEAYDEAYGNRDFREVAALEVKLADLREEQSDLTGELVRYAGELKTVRAAQLEFDESTDEVIQGVDALTNRMLILKPELLGVTGETTNLFDAWNLLNPAIYEGAEASQTATGYMGDLSHEVNYQRNMVENLQREWANLIVTLIDGESDIGDFFDTVAKGFVRMVAEMASADLASVIFGGAGGNLAGLISGGGGASAGSSLLGGASSGLLAGGLSLSGIASGASGFAQGLFGFGQGASSFMGPMTQSAAMGANFGAFMTSPVGIAIAAALAGKFIHDKTNDPDGFHRAMGGFLSGNTPGAPASSQFSVSPFATGLQVTGFADGPTSIADATKNIDQLRFIDQVFADAVSQIPGARIDTSRATLGGFGLDGTGDGTFFGRSQLTSDAQWAAQQLEFAKQIGRHIEGITPDSMAQIMGADSIQSIYDVLASLADTNTEASSITESNTAAVDSLSGAVTDAGRSIVGAGQTIDRTISGLSRSIDSLLNPQTVTASMGDAGTHFSNGSLVAGGMSFADRERQERVARNLEQLANGYNPMTGTYRSIQAPTMAAPAQQVSAIGLTGLTVDQENRQLLFSIEKNTAEFARILGKFDGDGLPEERA